MSTDPSFENAADLLRYIDASPSPYHCVAETARRLEAAGFEHLDEGAPWSLSPGDARYIIRGGGSLIAFRVGSAAPAEGGFRVVGAHTDSPNLRLKTQLARAKAGQLTLDVEVYGGPILATWIDRDLALAGRVFLAEGEGLREQLVQLDRPLARVPSLAIHLDRGVNTEGLKVDPHLSLAPLMGPFSGEDDAAHETVRGLICDAAAIDPGNLRGHDLCLYDAQPGVFAGHNESLIHTARLDNQAMCHAGLCALIEGDAAPAHTSLLALFDHEEVGSGSRAGAAGPFLRDVLTRLSSLDPTEGALQRAMSRTFVISADMAHALHPSRPELHDGSHLPRLNGGPVIKVNVKQRYATDAETGGFFRALCAEAGVPCQEYVHRADLPCGSTIGPITAGQLGARVVDVGNPMLSMHSARELAGAEDPALMVAAMRLFFDGAGSL